MLDILAVKVYFVHFLLKNSTTNDTCHRDFKNREWRSPSQALSQASLGILRATPNTDINVHVIRLPQRFKIHSYLVFRDWSLLSTHRPGFRIVSISRLRPLQHLKLCLHQAQGALLLPVLVLILSHSCITFKVHQSPVVRSVSILTFLSGMSHVPFT